MFVTKKGKETENIKKCLPVTNLMHKNLKHVSEFLVLHLVTMRNLLH